MANINEMYVWPQQKLCVYYMHLSKSSKNINLLDLLQTSYSICTLKVPTRGPG